MEGMPLLSPVARIVVSIHFGKVIKHIVHSDISCLECFPKSLKFSDFYTLLLLK